LRALSTAEAGEPVRVTSLDLESAVRGWPSIDFIKIDAEGEEERIVEGGLGLLTAHSPLVMFEVKAGAIVNERLRALLPAIGYRRFRQLEGEPILVPQDASQTLDGAELNLFAAKPDRVSALSKQGLLVDASPPWVPGDEDRKKGEIRFGGTRGSLHRRARSAGFAWRRISSIKTAWLPMQHGAHRIGPLRRDVRRLRSRHRAFGPYARGHGRSSAHRHGRGSRGNGARARSVAAGPTAPPRREGSACGAVLAGSAAV